MAHKRRTYEFKRGDKFDGIRVKFRLAAFDFTGTSVKAQLRDKPDGGELIHSFAPSVDTATLGEAEILLDIPGSSTSAFPVNIPLYGDVQIQGPGDFGPYTPVEFIIIVKPDISQ